MDAQNKSGEMVQGQSKHMLLLFMFPQNPVVADNAYST